MKQKLAILIGLMGLATLSLAHANTVTHRTQLFTNEKVKVYSAVIYPGAKQTLSMHRHDNPRVLVALTDGILKITNDKGQSHELALKKDQAYYLKSDPTDEKHQDENVSTHPIKVMVIELQ